LIITDRSPRENGDSADDEQAIGERPSELRLFGRLRKPASIDWLGRDR
jgi:hypothetical protein